MGKCSLNNGNFFCGEQQWQYWRRTQVLPWLRLSPINSVPQVPERLDLRAIYGVSLPIVFLELIKYMIFWMDRGPTSDVGNHVAHAEAGDIHGAAPHRTHQPVGASSELHKRWWREYVSICTSSLWGLTNSPYFPKFMQQSSTIMYAHALSPQKLVNLGLGGIGNKISIMHYLHALISRTLVPCIGELV